MDIKYHDAYSHYSIIPSETTARILKEDIEKTKGMSCVEYVLYIMNGDKGQDNG